MTTAEGHSAHPGRLLKAGTASIDALYPPARLLKGNLLEAEALSRQARDELDAARRSAQETCDAAERQAEHIRADAHNAGWQAAAQEASVLLSHLRQQTEHLRARMAIDAQQLAAALAREILGVELRCRPETIVDLVRTALDRVKLYREITVVLHPDDLAHLRGHEEELVGRLLRTQQIALRGDSDLPLHGCRIETEMGVFEASVDVQLQQLCASLGIDPPPSGGPGHAEGADRA